jgi:Cupin-like domain
VVIYHRFATPWPHATAREAMPDVILKNVPGMAAATSVPVLDARSLTESAFKGEYVAYSRPCVIKGAVSHWPATRKWRDREYLKSVCGSEAVPFWPHENHVTNKRVAPGKTNIPFADAIDRLHNAEGAEVAAIGCNSGTAEMAADIGGFSFFTQAELAFTYPPFRFFIFRNAGSTWHYHPFDETLMCQVIGTKKVGLLKVDNPHHKVLRRIFFTEDYYEDPSVFEELSGADLQWFSASLGEGDALYIPPLWWHGVIATSDGVGVTTPVGWRSPPHVIADGLRKMAAGNFDLTGGFNSSQFHQLLEAARKLGLERELEIAWKRAVAQRLVSVEA